MKFVAFAVVAVIALVAVTGCISDDSAAAEQAALDQELAAAKYQAANHLTDAEAKALAAERAEQAKPQHVTGVASSTNHYGWTEVSGVVVNRAADAKSVAVYVDFYDASGVKVDHVMDFVDVDGNGKSAFSATSTKGGIDHYRAYVDHVY